MGNEEGLPKGLSNGIEKHQGRVASWKYEHTLKPIYPSSLSTLCFWKRTRIQCDERLSLLFRATRALHYSGTASLEQALTWIEEHENDADLEEPLLVAKVDCP